MIAGFTRGMLLRVYAVVVVMYALGHWALTAALGNADAITRNLLGSLASFLVLGLIWTVFGFLFSQVFPAHIRAAVRHAGRVCPSVPRNRIVGGSHAWARSKGGSCMIRVQFGGAARNA